MNGTGFSYQEVQKSLIQSLFTEQIMIPKISSFINVDDFNDEILGIIICSVNND